NTGAGQCAVLRTMERIDAPKINGVVGRRMSRAPRGGGGIVFPAATHQPLVLACLGRLQQGEVKFAIGGSRLLSLRRQRWNPAIGWIDNQRRARPSVLRG